VNKPKQTRRLEKLQAVYLWVDGIDVKAGLEKDNGRYWWYWPL